MAEGPDAHRMNPVERVIRRIDRFQQRHPALAFPVAVVQKFGNDQAGARAALIAYYGLFAVFPLLLLLFTTILGYVIHGNESLRHQLLNSALGTFPIIGTQLQSPTHQLEGSVSAVLIGSVLLLYGAIGLGQATQAGMNAVWNIPYVRRPGFVPRYLRSLAVLALIAASTVGSTVLTGFATGVTHGTGATAILLLGSTIINFFLILIGFQVMTAEDLRWRDIALGAALAAVFWQVLQAIGSWYMTRGLQHNSDTYGFFAVVILLVSWIYIGTQLFLLAAEINVVLHYRLWPRSLVQPPLTSADKEMLRRLARVAVHRPEATLTLTFDEAAAARDPLADADGPHSGAPGPPRGSRGEDPRPGGPGDRRLRCPAPVYRDQVSPVLHRRYTPDTTEVPPIPPEPEDHRPDH